MRISLEELEFLLLHDLEKAIAKAFERILAYKEMGCLIELYDDEWSSILRHTCWEGKE